MAKAYSLQTKQSLIASEAEMNSNVKTMMGIHSEAFSKTSSKSSL